MRCIDEGATPWPIFLRLHRIGDHSTNRLHIRRIEPANEQDRSIAKFRDGAVALKIGIVKRA